MGQRSRSVVGSPAGSALSAVRGERRISISTLRDVKSAGEPVPGGVPDDRAARQANLESVIHEQQKMPKSSKSFLEIYEGSL